MRSPSSPHYQDLVQLILCLFYLSSLSVSRPWSDGNGDPILRLSSLTLLSLCSPPGDLT